MSTPFIRVLLSALPAGYPLTLLPLLPLAGVCKTPEHHPRYSGGSLQLSTQTQTLDEGTVTVDVNALEVVKQATTVTDHQLHTTTGVVVVLVLLEVLGQISDTLAQQSNLDLRRAGVTFMGRVLSDDFLLFFSRQCTASSLYCCAVLPARCRRALYPRAKYAKGQYTGAPDTTNQTNVSRPPNITTSKAIVSITKR